MKSLQEINYKPHKQKELLQISYFEYLNGIRIAETYKRYKMSLSKNKKERKERKKERRILNPNDFCDTNNALNQRKTHQESFGNITNCLLKTKRNIPNN